MTGLLLIVILIAIVFYFYISSKFLEKIFPGINTFFKLSLMFIVYMGIGLFLYVLYRTFGYSPLWSPHWIDLFFVSIFWPFVPLIGH